jgi:sec-independent protein translocase protein TatB
MFDLAWSEIALIGVVALVVIGPKDLPEAIRGVARGITKLRRMASEFQGQADELVREANLDEVRNSINEIRNFNVRDQFTKAVDKDGSIRKTFTEDPLKTDYTPYTPPPVVPETNPPPPGAMEGAAASPGSAGTGSAEPTIKAEPAAPAFIPPAFVPPTVPPAASVAAPSAAAPTPPVTPAFVPPADPAPAPPTQTQS